MPHAINSTSLRNITIGAAGALVASLALASAAQAERIFAVASVLGAPTLIRFESDAPAIVTVIGVIGALDADEQILGIDYRPLDCSIYGVTSGSRLIRIDRHTAEVTDISPAPFSTALDGTSFGFDFNPQIDRIRAVSDADQNLVLNPISGALQLVATAVFYPAGDPNEGANPNVVHHAYDQNNVNTPATQLRAIDTNLDMLVKQANNAGTLTTVGPLGTDFKDVGGFDVSGATGIAYAISTDEGPLLGQSTLYSIDLATGAATSLGVVGIPRVDLFSVEAMTVVPAPACLGNLNFDGTVDAMDLGILLGAWDTGEDRSDITDDGTVDAEDLAMIMGEWGRCGG